MISSGVRKNSILAIFVYSIISIQYLLCHAECEIPKKDIYSSDVIVFCDGKCLSFCVPTVYWTENDKKYNCTFSLITPDNMVPLTLAGSNANLNVEMLTCNLTTASVLKDIEAIGLKPDQKLILNGANLTESDTLDGYEKITDLRLINVQMADVLDEQIFERFKKLTRLDLVNNSIDALPTNIFQNQTKLRSLNLANNNLTSLPLTVFDNLQNLIALDLSGNGLEAGDLEPLNNLKKLEVLNLSRNQVDNVSADLLDSFVELKSLSLAANNLASLPDTIFSKVSKLVQLDLSGNHLKRVQLDLFNDLETLDVLNLSNNQLDFKEYEGMQSPFKNLTKLTELNLGSNKISNYLKDFWNFCTVRLNLSNNNLQTIKDDDLPAYSNQTDFWLKGNPWKCYCDSEFFLFIRITSVQDVKDVKCANNMTLDEQRVNCKDRISSITAFYIFMLLFIIGMLVIVGVVFLFDKHDERLKNRKNSTRNE